jgi:hypothetical protein
MLQKSLILWSKPWNQLHLLIPGFWIGLVVLFRVSQASATFIIFEAGCLFITNLFRRAAPSACCESCSFSSV